MNPLVSIEQKPYALTGYLILTFVFTWSVLGLAALGANGVISVPVSTTVLVTLGTLGPFVAAISVTARESGRPGVRALLAQAGRWRVRRVWYEAALFVPALIMLLAFLLWRTLGGPQLPFPAAAVWLSVPFMLVALAIPAMLEEVGWRGYALPRLQVHTGALAASLILGLVHAAWHLPLWFIPGMGFETLPFPFYILLVTGLSVLFSWLYNNSGGSLLIVTLLHTAINAYPAPWGTAVQMLPEGTQSLNIQIPVAIVVAACALAVVLLTDPRTLTTRR